MPDDIKIMTRNLYLGANLQGITSAALYNRDAVPALAAALLSALRASDIPGRLDRVAVEIATHRPHVVCVQEAFTVRRRTPSSLVVPPFEERPAVDVEFEFMSLLVQCLRERGMVYTIAIVTAGNNNQVPAGVPPLLEDVRLSDSEAILLRGDLGAAGIEVGDVGAQVFESGTMYGPFRDVRTWAHLNLVVRGRPLRIVTTHLQPSIASDSADIRRAQTRELVSAHDGWHDALVVCGDFNSRDDDGTATHRLLIDAGFTDAWKEVGHGPGFTCRAEEVRDPSRRFDERIDYLMFRNGLHAVDAVVTGNDADNRTVGGLWPSDHGGIVTTLRMH